MFAPFQSERVAHAAPKWIARTLKVQVDPVLGIGSLIIPLIVSRTAPHLPPRKAAYTQVYHGGWTDKSLATVERGGSLSLSHHQMQLRKRGML